MPYCEMGDGTRVYYKDWGAGRPVVFVHGWAVNADTWDYQAAFLAGQGLRCISYDRRGCGRSDQPAGGYDFDTWAEDLETLLAALRVRDAVLVAHSMGGGVATRYLTRYGSERVSQLVLVNATLPFMLKTTDNPDGVDPAFYEGMIAALCQDRPRYMALAAGPFFSLEEPGIEVSPETVAWGIGLALQGSLLAEVEEIRAFSSTDFRPELRELAVPTLVIHGARDRSVPPELTGQRTAALIPGCRLEEYETGHGLFITEKERLNRDLLALARA